MKKSKKRSEPVEPWLDAIYRQDMGLLREVIKSGVDVNACDRDGRSALMYAVENLDMVQMLIAHHADVNHQDKGGWTCLHFAAQDYRADIVEVLLENGAEVDVQEAFGNTALSKAVFNSRGRGGVIQLLLTHGADRNLKNNHGVSPLDLAHTIGNYDVAQFFE